jgi:hypothetical protein
VAAEALASAADVSIVDVPKSDAVLALLGAKPWRDPGETLSRPKLAAPRAAPAERRVDARAPGAALALLAAAPGAAWTGGPVGAVLGGRAGPAGTSSERRLSWRTCACLRVLHSRWAHRAGSRQDGDTNHTTMHTTSGSTRAAARSCRAVLPMRGRPVAA